MKILVSNKKANFEYFIKETFETGIVLSGDEVKSAREGHFSLNESYVSVKNGEVYLKNANIKNYDKSFSKTDEIRERKLLLHKKEIAKLEKSTAEQGLTIIPLKVYLKNKLIKMEIAIAQGKKLYDKRETIKNREQERSLRRELKQN